MSGQDLMSALQNSINLLNAAQREYRARGVAEAQAEKDYRIALSKKMLIERDNGMPVSIISDVCRFAGDRGIEIQAGLCQGKL